MENILSPELEEEAKKEEKRLPSYDLIVPGEVLNFKPSPIPKKRHTQLPLNAKLFYGTIRSLCHRQGYCWATNDYLAECAEVTPRAVQLWISQLKYYGFIKVQEFSNGFSNRRKVWLSDEFKKVIVTNSGSGGDERPFTHIKKNDSSKKKIYKEKETPRSARPTATTKITFNEEKRCFEGISIEDRKAWRDKFPALNLDKELGLCVEWALHAHRDNYRKSILTWLRNTQEKHTTAYILKEEKEIDVLDEDVVANKKLAEEWERKYNKKRIQNYDLHAKPSNVLFKIPNNDALLVNYQMPTEEFKKKCQTCLQRMKI